MVPDATLLFVGLDALCLLWYLARRRRRRARRPRFDYLGMYADS